MTIALTHRTGVHGPDGLIYGRDPELEVRASGTDLAVVGYGPRRITVGWITYGWTIRCVVCSHVTDRTSTRTEALIALATHLGYKAPPPPGT
jgi:hypothetical protein